MFANSRKNVCAGAASFLALTLLVTTAQAQGTQPLFPGLPTGGSGNPGAGGVYTPFNPLSGAATNPGSNPSAPPFYPSYPGYNQYYMDPVGSYLYGTSAVITGVGQFQMNRESAQVLHQVALQKQIETTKMMFDLEMYIKKNTPSFTDNQIAMAKETLKRILQNATPGEIWNGKALNVLLKDLKQQMDLDKTIFTAKIPEKTLRQLNITDGKNGSLGLLKDKGRFTWPVALLDDELISKELRDAMQNQAEQLVIKALNGSFDDKAYKDLKTNINVIREKLNAKVLTLDTAPYMQAKRFLDNFDESLMALQTPQVAMAHLDYQQFIKGGRTLQEVVEYLKKEGLSFAPASPGDEAAYEVLYSALANYDLMFNTQLVAGKKQ